MNGDVLTRFGLRSFPRRAQGRQAAFHDIGRGARTDHRLWRAANGYGRLSCRLRGEAQDPLLREHGRVLRQQKSSRFDSEGESLGFNRLMLKMIADRQRVRVWCTRNIGWISGARTTIRRPLRIGRFCVKSSRDDAITPHTKPARPAVGRRRHLHRYWRKRVRRTPSGGQAHFDWAPRPCAVAFEWF
jgi:hypothetical protein